MHPSIARNHCDRESRPCYILTMASSIRESRNGRMASLGDGNSTDPFLELDIAHNATVPLTTKLLQALELMSFGFELQRQTIANQNPSASQPEIDSLFNAWLTRDD